MSNLHTSDDKTPGVRTFRIQSDSDADTWYTIKRIRRPKSYHGAGIRNRWICTCNDFINRRMLANTHCKHIKRVRAYAQFVGGVSKIPRGAFITIADNVPLVPRPKLRMPRRK